MLEPGENTTMFTMFGSKTGTHQWVIVTVDLKAAFRNLIIISNIGNRLLIKVNHRVRM